MMRTLSRHSSTAQRSTADIPSPATRAVRPHHGDARALRSEVDVRSPRFGRDFSRTPLHASVPAVIQTKLAVGEPHDAYEDEAERIAERVTAGPTSARVSSAHDDHVQPRRVATGATDRPAAASSVEHALAEPGQAIDPMARSLMESRFGHDFSHVRVHADRAAEQSARQMDARAYTVGRDIVFGEGQYAPHTTGGQRLLAHELTHTIQQGFGSDLGAAQRSTSLLQRQPKGGTKKAKPAPPPVPGGNILYIGMNNYKPEVAKLQAIYKDTSVKVTTVTVSEEEAKTQAKGNTYDLTSDAGIKAFALDLGLDGNDPKTNAPLRGKRTQDVEALLTSQSSSDRDDLAHVISVYAATEADGVDRMSRVVLSGHSAGTKVYNEDVKGSIYFDALVTLAGICPKAARQTRHLLILACYAGEEDNIKNVYTKAFPNLQTFAGYTNACPTGSGAAASLRNWAGVTDKDPTKMEMPPSGQSNWAMGAYQTNDPIDAKALMSRLRTDESTFDDYFKGTKVDPNSHSGFLFEYYGRARTAELHTSEITGADHDYAKRHADQSYRLRFWSGMVSHFWKKNKGAITTGYGTATVPSYGTMTRKDALAAIAAFGSTSTATGATKAEAERLLDALRDLDPKELNDNWIAP